MKPGTDYEIDLYWVNNANVRSLASTVNVTIPQKEGVIEHIYVGDLLLPNQKAIDNLQLKYTSVTGKLRIGMGHQAVILQMYLCLQTLPRWVQTLR